MVTAATFAGDDIKVYRVPKAQPIAAQLPSGHPPMAGGATAAPTIKYQTPDGWQEAPVGQMRVASFNVKNTDGKMADISVIPLPGSAGGDAPNVNRWREQQLGLQAQSADEIAKAAETVVVAGQPAQLHDLVGTNPSTGEPTRIMGVIQHREGIAWFYKMSGDDKLVASQKDRFVAFLKSVEYTVGNKPEGLPPSHPPVGGDSLPAGHPDISKMSVATEAPISREGQPKWEVPPGWKEVSGGQFLVAKFLLSGEGNSQAAVNVSTSPGDGGGLAGNVNRWRGQLGLAPWSTDELSKGTKTLKINGSEAALVELAGTDARSGQPAGLIGAIVPQGGQTWFYKLMGDSKIVAGHRDAFTHFVETVKY